MRSDQRRSASLARAEPSADSAKTAAGRAPAEKTAARKAPAEKTAARKAPAKKTASRTQRAGVTATWLTTISTLADENLAAPRAWSAATRQRVPLVRRLTTVGDDKSRVLAEAQLLQIGEMLLQRSRMRVIARALSAKTSQDELALSLGTSQATVSRLAGQIREDPTLLEDSPTEIIAKRAVGEIGDDGMLKALLACSFTPGQYDPTGGDGYVRGTWREIENALTSGLLSDEEYEEIARGAPIGAEASAGA